MRNRVAKRAHDECGASLIIVIALMVLMGTISAAVISTAGSGIQQRVTLDQARNREYDADAGIEQTVVAARGLSGNCAAQAAAFPTLNSVRIHVDCTSVPAYIVGSDGIPKLQKNLSFAACVDTGLPCTPSTTIINAQVNFQGTAPSVTTYVQAWSVNR